MRIAITGASGFIGKELIEALSERKETKLLALTRGGTQVEASSACKWIETDYSTSSLSKSLQGTDIVVHLAGVRGTSQDPSEYAVNKVITENLLKAITESKVKRIVFASTISVYDDVNMMPWNENTPLKGRTDYGDSKIQCERLIQEYAEDELFTYAIARIAQVIGEGEKRRGMMNVFIDTAREHGILNVFGKSIAKRQYIYIKDLIDVLAALAIGDKNYSTNDNLIVNVGMPDAYTNLEIAKIINEVFNNPTPINYDNTQPETIKSAYMDTHRLNDVLGFIPRDMASAISDFL